MFERSLCFVYKLAIKTCSYPDSSKVYTIHPPASFASKKK